MLFWLCFSVEQHSAHFFAPPLTVFLRYFHWTTPCVLSLTLFPTESKKKHEIEPLRTYKYEPCTLYMRTCALSLSEQAKGTYTPHLSRVWKCVFKIFEFVFWNYEFHRLISFIKLRVLHFYYAIQFSYAQYIRFPVAIAGRLVRDRCDASVYFRLRKTKVCCERHSDELLEMDSI